jgi:hypothetical protein
MVGTSPDAFASGAFAHPTTARPISPICAKVFQAPCAFSENCGSHTLSITSGATTSDYNRSRRATMNKLLSLGAAAIAGAAVFAAATPVAAKDYEYCRRDSSYMLACGYETLAQCQDMASGRGGDCIRSPSLAGAADAYAYAPIARKHRDK